MIRGGVRSTRGLGSNMTAQGQSIGISIGMLDNGFCFNQNNNMTTMALA